VSLNLTADPERVKHLLITARDELAERGWMQGDYGTVDGPKCTVGAVQWAAHGRPDWYPNKGMTAEEIDANHVIESVLGTWAVVDWNDTNGRTVDEVIAAYDEGIGLVDAEIARRASVAQVEEIAYLAGIETAVAP
jgi:hypothetical protein